LDSVETTFELSSISGTFVEGETVTGGTSSITGEVARWDATTSYLYLINMTGTFTLNEIITGATSLATGTASLREKNLKLISGTSTFKTTLDVEMWDNGTASSSVKTVDNSSGEEIITETKVNNLPLGMT